MIKVCFTINPDRTTEDFLNYDLLIKQNLFQAIEIFYPYNKTTEEIETYKQNVLKLMKNNIEVVLHLPHGPFNDLCADNYDEMIEKFKKAIDFGKNFQTRKMTLHLGYQKINDQYRNRQLLLKRSINTLRTLCDYAYPANIMIENMPGEQELGYSPQEIKQLIEDSKRANLKFIFDFGHAHLSNYPPQDYLVVLKDYLYHLHLSDNDKTGDKHGPLGTGTIDFKTLFKHLDFYQELYCLEIIFKTTEDLKLYQKTLMEYF